MPVWRENEAGHQVSLKITRAGRDAIGVQDAGSESAPPVSAGAAKKARQSPTHATETTPVPAAASAARPGTKRSLIIALLSRPTGASLDEMIQATDWLPHTTRAALTGLRHQGMTLERSRGEDRVTRYRVIGSRAGLLQHHVPAGSVTGVAA